MWHLHIWWNWRIRFIFDQFLPPARRCCLFSALAFYLGRSDVHSSFQLAVDHRFQETESILQIVNVYSVDSRAHAMVWSAFNEKIHGIFMGFSCDCAEMSHMQYTTSQPVVSISVATFLSNAQWFVDDEKSNWWIFQTHGFLSHHSLFKCFRAIKKKYRVPHQFGLIRFSIEQFHSVRIDSIEEKVHLFGASLANAIFAHLQFATATAATCNAFQLWLFSNFLSFFHRLCTSFEFQLARILAFILCVIPAHHSIFIYLGKINMNNKVLANVFKRG